MNWSLERTHSVSRSVQLRQSREVVWEVLTDFAGMPSWRKDVQRVERLADRNGHEVWLEVVRGGRFRIPLETVEAIAQRRLVRRIADPELAFGGTWTYHLVESEGGTLLTITEDGEVKPLLFRVMARFMNQAATIERFLAALANRLGE